MNLSALINNTSVQVTALDTHETIDGRSVAKMTVYDAPGTAVYEPRTPVLITDSITGYSFSGYVNDDQIASDANGVAMWHTLACVDETDLASKRYYAGTEWQNRYAGDISTDIVESTLSAEGVTAAYAIDEDNGADDWQEGTQTNTAGVQTATGGALELALAGSIVTKTESLAANWNAGTLTGAMVNGNLLQLNAHPALSFSGVCSSGYGNAYAYYRIWSGAYVIQSGDKLRYNVWINSSSPTIMAGVDAICTDGTSLRDFNSHGGGATGAQDGFTFDQNGLRCHPGTDLSGFANDQWYSRSITFLSGMVGKTISYVDIAFEGDNAGTYQAYFYDVWIKNSTGTVTQNLFGNQGVISPLLSFPNVSAKVSNVGYSNVQINAITAYEATGTRISQNNSMQGAGIYQSSLLSWLATIPTNTALSVYTSVDGGATYQLATNQTAIASIPLGASLTSRNITTKIVMSISGKDPTATPQVSNITWTVLPAYAATQTGTRQKYDTQTDWNTGTRTNTVATSGGDLTINSSLRDWNDALTTNQTLFGGGGSALQSTFKLAGSLRAATTAVARSRLDFAGTWQNFTMSIDIQVPAANVFVGVCYRTTYWDNLPNTEAYVVDLSTTTLNIGRGTNNVTNSHTVISPSPFTFSPALNTGEWHTLTITVAGSNHQIYLDGVLYFNVTDATFSAAGNFGLRLYNNTAGDYTTYYDNFGVMDASGVYPGPGTFSGPTWVSASISLGSFTAGNNLIFWDASTIAGDYLNVQTSFNGGTYTNATSGSPIPGIVSGTAYVSATLQVKVQMQSATAADTPVLHGLTVWVTSLYNSVGNRISVPLSLAPVGTAGNTALAWAGVQPANTAILVDTSLDGTNWSNAGIGASGQATIAGILTQSDPVVDQFSTDTSNNYTSTCRTGGTLAAWVWDILHNRLTVSGGVNAHLLYNSPTLGSNVDISVVLDISDNGGFVWRWLDQGDHYSLVIHDASSNNNPNTAQLYVITGGGGGTLTPLTEYYTNTTSTTIGTAKQLSETLGTGAFTTKQSTIGTALNFGELFAAGTTGAWAASASLLAPSDNGFIDDSVNLEGQTLIAGGWAPTVRLGLNLTATITADVWCRVSKRSSGGTRTIIGDCLLSNQTITGTTATYTFPSTNLGSMSFATGDRLCFNFQLNVLTNTNGLTGLACKIGESSIANTGLTTSQVVTPGFQVGSGGATTLLSSVPITFPRTTPHAFRVTMVGSTITFLMDGNALMNVSDSTITSPGFAGLRNDNAGGGSTAQFYLFRLQFYGQDVTNSVLYSRFRLSSTDPTATPQINQYSMSVHDPSIQPGALIPQTSYSVLNGNKKTCAAIYDDLAAQSGNFWWKIIAFQLFFQQHQAQPAPWVLTPQGATGVDIVDSPQPTLDNINDTYRNSQWGTGGTDIIPQTRSFIGNGTQTTFDLVYNVDSIISISLGNAPQTFGIANSSTGVNWYYTQGQSGLVQDASAVPISGSSQVLTVVFNAQTTITTNVQSPSEVTRVGNLDNTTGIIDEGEDMSGLPKAAMIAKCAGFLSQFGQKSKTLTYTTRRPGLSVGQLQCAFVGPLGAFAGAFLLTDIKGTWQAEGEGDGTVIQKATFAVSGTSGPITLNWARFINSLGGAK